MEIYLVIFEQKYRWTLEKNINEYLCNLGSFMFLIITILICLFWHFKGRVVFIFVNQHQCTSLSYQSLKYYIKFTSFKSLVFDQYYQFNRPYRLHLTEALFEGCSPPWTFIFLIVLLSTAFAFLAHFSPSHPFKSYFF